MTTAPITCVVTAHREAQLIYTTLRSVDRARTYAQKQGIESELIIILDRPDELTREYTAAHAGESSRVFEVDFGEPAQSRNFAVTKIETEYTTFLDGDDLWCKTWLTECYQFFCRNPGDYILHPDLNAYFGLGGEHLMKHIDMESERFSHEFLRLMNYWTALSFSRTSIYDKTPYRKNRFDKGFGYEDWTWNWQTVQKGIVHKVVPGTIHFIRQGKSFASRSDLATQCRAIPEILDIYIPDPPNETQHLPELDHLPQDNKPLAEYSDYTAGHSNSPVSPLVDGFRITSSILTCTIKSENATNMLIDVCIDGVHLGEFKATRADFPDTKNPSGMVNIKLPGLKKSRTHHIIVSILHENNKLVTQEIDYCPLVETYRDKIEAIFYPEFYATRYLTNIPSNKGEILDHYLTTGLYKNHMPNPWFNPSYYENTFPQRLTNISNPLLSFLHFEKHGKLNPAEYLDLNIYQTNYPEASTNTFEHYVNLGGPRAYKAWKTAIPEVIKKEISNIATIEPSLQNYPIDTENCIEQPTIDRLTHTATYLSKKLDRSIEYIICVESSNETINEMVTALIQALQETVNPKSILVCVTDYANSEHSRYTPFSNIETIFLCDGFQFKPTAPRVARALHAVIGTLCPREIINVESEAMWEVINRYGKQLSRQANLTCLAQSLYLQNGLVGGYAAKYLIHTIDFLHTVICDNNQFIHQIDKLWGFTTRYRRKIHCLRTPANCHKNMKKSPEMRCSDNNTGRHQCIESENKCAWNDYLNTLKSLELLH